MGHDFDLSLRTEGHRDDYVGSEVDPDALHDARRDRAREMADALAAESAHWQAQGGHPAPSVWPDGAEWPCTCIPGERCCESDCESCWRTTTCQAEDLTAAEEYATARTQEAVEARGGDRP